MDNWKSLFKDEKDFTLRLIIPWLKTLKYENIRYTGGAEEYGRDVIFSKKKLWTGVQVKYGKIEGKHVGKSDIQELISQTKTAFTAPLVIEQGKKTVSISEIFIMTNENVTPQAKIILKAGLKNIPYKIFDITDIENSFKQQKIRFSKISILIRTPYELSKELLSKSNFKIYENKPSDDFFESEKDSYFDYSKEFENISSLLTFFKNLEKEKLNEVFIKIFLELPPIFNLHEIKEYCEVYFKDRKLNIFEEENSVNIEYKYTQNKFLGISWLRDVDNMQILQKK